MKGTPTDDEVAAAMYSWLADGRGIMRGRFKLSKAKAQGLFRERFPRCQDKARVRGRVVKRKEGAGYEA